MRFEILSFEPYDRQVVQTSYGVLPVYPLYDGESLYAPPEFASYPRTWHGLRYNEILVYEAARQLTNAGHEVSARAFSGDTPETAQTSVTFDQIHIPAAMCNHDVVFIRNMETGKYCVLDMQDYPTLSPALSASPNCIAVYMTMYESGWVHRNTTHPEKFKPFLYFPMFEEATYANIFAVRQHARRSRDRRLFFSGTLGNTSPDQYQYTYTDSIGQLHAWREVAIYLKELAPSDIVIFDRQDKLERRLWWKYAANFRWNLFLAGGPWCNREHELWIRGTATLGFEYPRHPLKIPIIPDYHYAAVPWPAGTDEQGRPIDARFAAHAILDRFYQIRDNEEFASIVSDNAAHRMDTDASTPTVVSQILGECWNL